MTSRAMIGVGLLCLAVTACEPSTMPPASPESKETMPATEADAQQPPRPPRKPPVPPAPPETAKVEPSEREALTPREAPTPRDAPTPESLIGLNQQATAALLGEPGERAEAAPATIWRYTG